MQPEDIDKLFRDKLAQHAPTPPAYLWNQLEDELQPAKKRPVLWMWAAAASVVLLLVSGMLWLQSSGLQPTGAGVVATVARPTRRTLPATTESTAPVENKNSVAAVTQATTPQLPASTTPEATTGLARSTQPPQSSAAKVRELATAASRSRAAAPARRPTDQLVQEAVAVQVPNPQPERLLEPVAPASQPQQLPATALALVATPAPAATGPIEVEVRRSAAPAVATTAQAAPKQRSLGGVLLRQARNAVRGERLSLAEAGLPETVTVQAHVAGRTLTKVIQL